jgi:hypothetical protein
MQHAHTTTSVFMAELPKRPSQLRIAYASVEGDIYRLLALQAGSGHNLKEMRVEFCGNVLSSSTFARERHDTLSFPVC